MKIRRSWLLTLVAWLCVAELGVPGALTEAAVMPASQLILGSLEEPPSLSALVDLPHHFPEHVPQTLLFDSLTQFMPDGTVHPKLAQR